MFHLGEISQEKKISSLFKEYNFAEDYKNYETEFYVDDKQFTVSLSQATVKQYHQELGKLLIIRDITEQKRAEEALRQSKVELERANTSLEEKVAERTAELQLSNEELRVTLSSIGDGVITMDTLGNVILLNQVAEQLTGWQQEDALGQPLQHAFLLLDEETRTLTQSCVVEALESREIVNPQRHTLLIARDGTERLITESGAPIIAQKGGILGAVLVFRDITTQRKIEEELIKAERLESIGVLAGGVAHDFNNILTAVIGNISLAKIYATSDDKTATRLTNAENAALRAQDLTQQLFSIAKGGTPTKTLSSIKELIQDTIDFSLRGSKVKCELDLPDDLWTVNVDAGQISQVINNLVINADQAMPNGGIISVRAENTTVEAGHPGYFLDLKHGEYIKISLRDSGIGMDEDQRQKIFDPYFTTKKQGSGLGLFTSYTIIKKHDGHIEVESEIGVGTTFHIYLPASSATQAVRPVLAAEELVAGKGSILVMDDEEAIRDFIGDTLTAFGYEVAFAHEGAEAIAAYQHAQNTGEPFDAVIMDLTIPGGMGGKEAMARIHAYDPQVKAIVASGYSNDPIMTEYQRDHFRACIAKPYKAIALTRILHDVLADNPT